MKFNIGEAKAKDKSIINIYREANKNGQNLFFQVSNLVYVMSDKYKIHNNLEADIIVQNSEDVLFSLVGIYAGLDNGFVELLK